MAERHEEKYWLYAQPSEGIVERWFSQALITNKVGQAWILDSALVLAPFYTEWDGSSNIRYKPEDVGTFNMSGPEVPSAGSRLWNIWQDYTQSPAGKADRNDPKMHLHSYSTTEDGKLLLTGSDFDWHRMRLGLMLRDGQISERYRDGIVPVRVGNRFVFKGVHPNNTNSHSVVITSDNHLVLATRGQAVDYYAGYTAASVEQQTNPTLEHSLFDSYMTAVDKLSGMRSELNLTVKPETLRLGGIFLEPDVNCAAFLVVGQVEEGSSQINPSIISRQRQAEFAPSPNSVWTLSLSEPEALIEQFYRPEGFLWHGTARLRIVAALSYVHGYQKALDLLYQGYQTA